MWTVLLLNGHLLPGPFIFPVIMMFMCPQHKVSTTVDGLLMWTLLAWPLGVHIRGTLLYKYSHFQENRELGAKRNKETL